MRARMLAILLLLTLLAASLAPATIVIVQANPFNSRLAVQVASTGLFNMGAYPDPGTGGSTSASWDLMYRWPLAPSTSFTTIRIDGLDTMLGVSALPIEPPTDIDTGTNRSRWQIGDIEVTQILQVVFNNQTGQEDVARIAYTVRNIGAVPHSVGSRVMIDTEINGNDGAVFRVPGIGLVTNETQFFGDAIPSVFQEFFGVNDSTHVAASTVRDASAMAPDRLVMAYWGHLYYGPAYDYTIDPNFNFTHPPTGVPDSAYALFWNSAALAPGESRTYATNYGLAQLTVDLRPPLALGVTGPATLSVANGQYSPNPFDITATIFNNGSATATGVALTLNLPDELNLAGGDVTQLVGDLAPGEERQIFWRAAPYPFDPNVETAVTYSVTASASNAASKTVDRQIIIPPLGSPTADCVSSTGSWANSAIAAQTGAFTVEFDATPDIAPMDGVIGFSANPAAAYTDLAAIVRFAPEGVIDSRNGGAYQAAAQIPYTAGTRYHFRMVVHVPSHTYDAYVTKSGGAEQTIGLNYAFRTEQSGASQLAKLALYAKSGSHVVCNISATDLGVPVYSISGHVVDSNNLALGGVTIADDAGHVVVTDGNGNYMLSETSGTYKLTSAKVGYSFTPSTIQISVPPARVNQNFTATRVCPSALSATINEFALDSTAYIERINQEALKAAQDGDYFAVQKKADEIKLIADGIMDSVSILAVPFDGIDKVKDATKMQLPGVVGSGWGHVLQLRDASKEARNAFVKTLSLPVTTANAQLAARTFMGGAYKYYAADMLDQAAEDLVTDKAVEYGFQVGLQSPLALENNAYPALQRLSVVLKQDMTKTSANSSSVLPCLSAAQETAYAQNLQSRTKANLIMQSTFAGRAFPLHAAQSARVGQQDNWVSEFLAKYLLKGAAGLAFDGPGILAVEGGAAIWHLYQNERRLNEDMRMAHLGEESMAGAVTTEEKVYLNTVSGIDNITQGVRPQTAAGSVLNISNKSVGEYKLFGQAWWWERDSFSEISLANTTRSTTQFQALADYGNTGFLGTHYQPLVEEGVSSIAGQQNGLLRIRYKQGDQGVSPDQNSSINIQVLGSTDTGTYYIATSGTDWQPTRVDSNGQPAALPVSVMAQAATDPPTLPYPIHSYVDVQADNLTYVPRIRVSNPYTRPIQVIVTQAIPVEAQVIDPRGGNVTGQSISWSRTINPLSAIEMSYSIVYTSGSGQTVQYPAAQLVMSDSEGNTATFDSDVAPFITQTPLAAEGDPPVHLARNQIANVHISITNRASVDTSGTVRLVLTDLNGIQIDTASQVVQVSSSSDLPVVLPVHAPDAIGTYILSGVVESNGGTYEAFTSYVDVTGLSASIPVYIPVIAR